MAHFIRLRATKAAAVAVASGGTYAFLRDPSVSANDRGGGGPALESFRSKIGDPYTVVPPRAVQESALIGASPANPLDILVVGGGATGCGVALDAATRGLRVGLVEREDFSSGTSSRSTKLLHGGVRYLEKAVFNFDYGQLKLVFHALEERKQVIENAPHLCHALPCMTPCFEWFEVVYFWMGLKLYDLVAGPRLLHLSRYYSAQESVELFPTLARKGRDKTLKGTVVYYDGQMNDSRLNVGLACTAALAGAAVLNHAEVISFLKDEGSERITGARVRDNLTVSMAEDAVDAAIKSGKLSPGNKCLTYNLRLVGGEGWDPASFTVLAQQYVRMKKTYGGKVVPGVMDTAAAKHLSHAYGTLAERVAAIAQNENLGKRLAHGYPFLEAEVAYCARHEYCESAIDFIARRSRLAFLDTDAAGRALPRIIQILAVEHKWDKSRQKQEVQMAIQFLETFKSSKNAQFHDGKHK
ncbi:hypothetical protein C3L33_02794, partial [Rhododendron williamsianum]